MFSNSKLFFLATALLATQYIADAASFHKMTPADLGYFDTAQYKLQTAAQKLNDLWQQCLADKSELPNPQNFDAASIFKESVKITFNRKSDEMPEGRVKFVHSQGVVAKVIWEDLGNHPYTGLYQGNSEGLIRLSEGNQLVPESTGLTPTLAIKFPRDGMHSVNHVANSGFEPTKSFNFFSKNFGTNIALFQDPINQETIERKFLEVTPMIGAVGKAEFSRFKSDGKLINDYMFPFGLRFTPHPDVAKLFPDTKEFDENGKEVPWFEQLKRIPEGTILFQVFARNVPNDPAVFPETKLDLIANIRLNSDLITSTFGDKRLFFQHEHMTLDQVSEPEWKDYTVRLERKDAFNGTEIPEFPTDPVEQQAWVRGQIAEYKCPFAWILNEVVHPIF